MRAFLAMMLTFGKGTAPPTVLMKSAWIRLASLPMLCVSEDTSSDARWWIRLVVAAKFFELEIFRFSARVALEVRKVAFQMMAH